MSVCKNAEVISDDEQIYVNHLCGNISLSQVRRSFNT